MHDNDLLDAVVEFHSVYFRSKRWTIRLASWVIDVVLANGYIHAKHLGIERNHDSLHAFWIGNLIDQLIVKSGVQLQQITSTLLNLEDRLNKDHPHYPQHINVRKMCVVCYKQHKIQTRTRFKCNIVM